MIGCMSDDVMVKMETRNPLLVTLSPAATRIGSMDWIKFIYQSFTICANERISSFFTAEIWFCI